jgi:fumarate reductase flavoprotein subunit
VIEQSAACLGSSSMSLGSACAAGTEEQRIAGVEDDAETYFADIMSKTKGSADPVVARTVAVHSGPTLDWLARAHDVVFALDRGWRPAFGHTRARMHATAQRSGADMMMRLSAACDRAGVDVLTNARASDFFVDEAGEVAGVKVLRPDGSAENIRCGALILATCGYGGNADLIARHIPSMRTARYFGWEGNQGTAVLLGEAIGARLEDMDAYQGLGLLAEPQGIDVNPRFLIEGGVQVNILGERFSNELDDVSGQGARVIAQPGAVSWLIYDERIHQSCEDLPQYRILMDLNARRSAPALDALAETLGVDKAPLLATLQEVEGLARRGGVDRFGRRFSAPPLEAPYHALKVTGALFHTLGGLAIDGEARVLRRDGRPFATLFAGGGAARGFSGSGPSGYLPGAGLCAALTLGALAGRSAAAQASAKA